VLRRGAAPKTTVIGSYPIFPSPQEVRPPAEGEDVADPFLKTIEASVRDFVSAGIEVPSTGQTRDHFVRLFLDPRHVEGIERQDSEIIVRGKVSRKSPIRKQDVQYARMFLPEYYEFKEPITGPYTLARSCRLMTTSYPDLKALTFDLARRICREEALDLQGDVDYLQFDEPYLSIDPWRDWIIDLYRELTEGLRVPIVLHVCGDSIHVFRYLVKMPVDILSLDFTYNPKLMDEVARRRFPQKIGFGCVSTGNPVVEPPSSIRGLIEEGIRKIGAARIGLIHPGCGERSLPLDAAYQKNVNMVLARNEVFFGEATPAEAKPLRREDYDPKGYFLIQTDLDRKEIVVSYNSYKHRPMVRLRSTSAEKILYTVLDMGLISNTYAGRRHLAYLGYELGKAETALRSGIPYRQDRPLSLTRGGVG
jgi:5-methyltetrahydropteroyltriglutamate--homocysteine methyltransferase